MEAPVGLLVDGEDRGCGELLLELHRRIRGLDDGTRVRLLTTDPSPSGLGADDDESAGGSECTSQS